MRRFLAAVGLIALGSSALAADYDLSDLSTLRGSSPYVPAVPTYSRWSGFYFGGQVGYSASGMDFANATGDLIAFLLRETTIENEFHISQWPLLGKSTTSGFGFGGFAGYNSQWDEVIVGVDVNYTHSKLTGSSADTLGRMFTTTDDYNNQVDLVGSASLTLRDYVTVRGRAGYVLDSFLPYVTFGLAVGVADYTRAVTVTAQGTYVGSNVPPLPPYGPVTYSASESKNVVVFGYSAGLGIDFDIIPNVFARAEWEFVQFRAPDRINAYINTLRTGLGLRF